MDERNADERADQAPLPEQAEPTAETVSATSDETRQAGGDPTDEAPQTGQGEAHPGMPAPPLDTEASTSPPEASVLSTETVSEPPAPDSVQDAPEAAPAAVYALESASAESEPAELGEAAPTMTPAQEHRAAAAEGLRRGRLPQGEVPVEGGTEPAWYVIHCYSGYENKVRHNLEQRIETMGMKDRIFDVVIPTQEEIEVKEGKRRTVERHIFPGYVLVNMTLSEESWYVVRNTPGVTGFVGMGNLPTPLRPEEVSQIIKRMESEAPAVKVSFKVGERVRIIDGPFNDFRGTVADIDMERTKVRVMVSFFGRDTPVELDFLQVEKA
jgi:transcriptional antiterminator NusG